MAKIVSIHSFRGGTGKSNVTANTAAQFAMKGHRVGVIDTDIQSPGIHVLFGMDEEKIDKALNDYLWGRCAIEETAYDVGSQLGNGEVVVMSGGIYLIPSSIRAGEIARVLREGYDVGLLNDGFRALVDKLLAQRGEATVVMSYGNPHFAPQMAKTVAFVVGYGEGGWYGNQTIFADAFVRLLSGKIKPQGKLPVKVSDEFPIGAGMTF